VVKYLIVNCNIIIKEETLQYLQTNGLIETINIIKSRDLHAQLDNNLNNDTIENKSKRKI
jgi:hypothetical protein